MIAQDLLLSQRSNLEAAIRNSLGGSKHADAFAVFILGLEEIGRIAPSYAAEVPTDGDSATYGGYPQVAALGFLLATRNDRLNDAIPAFFAGLRKIKQRPTTAGTAAFAGDDVALLGVALGLAATRQARPGTEGDESDWLIQLIDGAPRANQWTNRMRALAGDLLDGRGRLRVLPPANDSNCLALDLVLRATRPCAYRTVAALSVTEQKPLIKALLTTPPPARGDLDQPVVWLRALDILVDGACRSLLPTVSETVQALRSVQHALKRWVWRDKPRRSNASASRWLIDDEYDVQSLLWAVLYPIYRENLVDEEYLPSWGNVQPRADLGITTLKLIIEVKVARQPADFSKIEEEVAGDLGLYFKDTARFDTLVAFVYDDCDRPQPERYDSLRSALMQRERVQDVVIIRRPSMIPNRGNRGAQLQHTTSQALVDERTSE